MANINLLPWREALRQKRNTEFVYLLILTTIFGVLLSAFAWFFCNAQLGDQQTANQQIIDAITQKNNKNKDLRGLKDNRKALSDRIKAVQNLQGSRPILVRLFDGLTRATPANMYLTKFQRVGNHFLIEGYAESAVVVSELMRNLDASSWYKDAVMTSFVNSNDPAFQTPPDAQNNATDATPAVTVEQIKSLAPRAEDSYGKFSVTAELEDTTMTLSTPEITTKAAG